MLPHAHVLVADDDPGLLSVVADCLTHLGAEVIRASSGLQAMHAARTAGLGIAVIVGKR